MRCAICNRPLNKPAVMIGSKAIGPKCAKDRGLTPQKPKFRLAHDVEHDPRQMALGLE